MRTPRLTPAAVEYLDGRPLLLRGSTRHGCCGGRVVLPVAEVGPPDDPDGYRRSVRGDVNWFVDPQLGDDLGGWTIDAHGIGRWKRLLIDGTQGVDPDVHRHHPTPPSTAG